MTVATAAPSDDDVSIHELTDLSHALHALFADEHEHGHDTGHLAGTDGGHDSDHHGDDHHEEGEEGGDGLSGALAQVTHAADRLEAAFSHRSHALSELDAVAEPQNQHWPTQADALFPSIGKLRFAVNSEITRTTSALDALETAIKNHERDVATHLKALVESMELLGKHLTSDLNPLLNSTLQSFSERVSGHYVSTLDNAYQLAEKRVAAELESVRHCAHQELERARAEVENCVAGAVDHARALVVRAVEQASRHFVNGAAEQVVSSVTNNVAMTQLGTSLTSSMAPIMPQLIALKHALPAIRALIEAVSKLKFF